MERAIVAGLALVLIVSVYITALYTLLGSGREHQDR